MIKLGLLGYPLSKSLSKKIFEYIAREKKIKLKFTLFETKNCQELVNEIIGNGYDGFFITIPFKEQLFKHPSIKPLSKKIGAINCVKIRDSKAFGINTDYLAFKKLISRYKIKGKTALIAGCGGSARASIKALGEMGVKKIFISARNEKKAKAMCKKFGKKFKFEVFGFNKCEKEYDIFINATPIGMYSNDTLNINFKNLSLLVDWAYDKNDTNIICEAKKKKINYIDGIEILVQQAIEGFKFITGILVSNINRKLIKYLKRNL
ncbi:MAG: hypothetical protein K6357_05985 [Elusimicrobiota bacterium]